MKTIYAFGIIQWHDFERSCYNEINSEINRQLDEYILKVDENKYKKYLFEKYYLTPLEIIKESENIGKPTKSIVQIKDYGRYLDREFKIFRIGYRFEGDSRLFEVIPTTLNMITEKIEIDERDKWVFVNVQLSSSNLDREVFEKQKNERFSSAFANLSNINSNAIKWNNDLKKMINEKFDALKSKYLKEHEFYKDINVNINESSNILFNVPAIHRQMPPQPSVDGNKKLELTPIINMKIYEDILKILNSVGKSFEKKESLYSGKDEESLRDLFLTFLETRYDSISATGETFNKKGKTDILLKYAQDGSNLFIAECKFWHGIDAFYKAIDQLFNLYLTWRDSKVALIIFVKEKEFSSIIEKVKSGIGSHKYFLKENGQGGESSLSYIFHFPDDKGKKVYLEVMLFHFPQ